MRPIVCFIDDSKFELDVFTENLIPAAPELDFILSHTYEDTKSKLGENHPVLFLLDLYGGDTQSEESVIPAKAEIEALVGNIPSLDSVYEGLEVLDQDPINEYLRRLFRITDAWRELFYKISGQLGQNSNYGLRNLDCVKRDYPAAAAVAYTRKALIRDAVEVIAEGAHGLSLKPTGPTDQDTRKATAQEAPLLLQYWTALVTERFIGHLKDLRLLLISSGLPQDAELLHWPEKLSEHAQAILGPGDMAFLQASAGWWEYAQAYRIT